MLRQQQRTCRGFSRGCFLKYWREVVVQRLQGIIDMEVDSSVKRVNNSDLEEVSSATQQKRVKTVFEILWDDTNSGVRKSI